ncbi:FecR family protein [Porphyromonas pogonae]|uniref:FecR family protein n=1 Tax=Porphyromonas pogonae TaxID=867595 RepID=UPI002E7829CD|nr:FecR family protein [Porphyromonas pogonae]
MKQDINEEDIDKVLRNEADPQKASDIAHWMTHSIDGYRKLSDLIDDDIRNFDQEEEFASWDTLDNETSDKVFAHIQQRIRRRSIIFTTLRYAVVLIPLIALGVVGYRVNKQVDLFGHPVYNETYVPKGEKARLIFQDGSTAYLNSDSKISYPAKFGINKREVFLTGEAYFEVSANKHRPFVVNTGNTAVKVYGTKFNVNAYNDNTDVEVVLDEGKVSFQTADKEYKIVPGQELIYNKAQKSCTLHNLDNSANRSKWKENILILHDTPLIKLIPLLERWYNVTFVIQDTEAIKYSFNLYSQNEKLEDLLAQLEKISPVQFRFINPQKIIIYLRR